VLVGRGAQEPRDRRRRGRLDVREPGGRAVDPDAVAAGVVEARAQRIDTPGAPAGDRRCLLGGAFDRPGEALAVAAGSGSAAVRLSAVAARGGAGRYADIVLRGLRPG